MCQAAGLSEGHISALLKLQSKFGAQMKELGHLHKESKKSKVSPEEKWKLWVNLKVKMRPTMDRTLGETERLKSMAQSGAEGI